LRLAVSQWLSKSSNSGVLKQCRKRERSAEGDLNSSHERYRKKRGTTDVKKVVIDSDPTLEEILPHLLEAEFN
jgi:hypothetical protein